MEKLYNSLQRQLKFDEYKEDAKDCLKIYEKLKELNNGSVWQSNWKPLVDVKFMGEYPNSIAIYKPNQMGYVFIKGLEEKKVISKDVRRIPIQIVIMSHLSDAQELISMNYISEANIHINFAKRLLIKYFNQDINVSEEELNQLWNEMKNQ